MCFLRVISFVRLATKAIPDGKFDLDLLVISPQDFSSCLCEE